MKDISTHLVFIEKVLSSCLDPSLPYPQPLSFSQSFEKPSTSSRGFSLRDPLKGGINRDPKISVSPWLFSLHSSSIVSQFISEMIKTNFFTKKTILWIGVRALCRSDSVISLIKLVLNSELLICGLIYGWAYSSSISDVLPSLIHSFSRSSWIVALVSGFLSSILSSNFLKPGEIYLDSLILSLSQI